MSSIKGLRQNNKGYSLVELIIVVAIITVLGGTVVYSISLIFSADAKGCAHSLSTALADTKINAMGREGAYLELKRDDNGDIWVTQWIKKGGAWSEATTPQKIGTRRITVYYYPSGKKVSEFEPSIGTELAAGGSSIYLSFDRSTGSYTESFKLENGTTTSGSFYSGFEIIGGSKDYLIELNKLTGKTQTTVR